MASLMDGIWAMADAMSQKKDNNVSRSQASVTRVDNEGIVWVHIPGGTDETPVNGRSVADAKSGDTVLVEISGGRCSIVGNATSPAVGERKVVETITPVAEQVENAFTAAAAAKKVADFVETMVREAKQGIEQVKRDISDFKGNVYTKAQTDKKVQDLDDAISTELTTNYTNNQQLSTTYATKTLVSQTKDDIELAASQTYETQSDAAATYATKSALTVGLDRIRSEVAEDYQPKGDYATTASMNSAIQQSASSIESSVAATYETKSDAAATYATKTEVQQTASGLDTRITTAQSTADGAASTAQAEVTERQTLVRQFSGGVLAGYVGNSVTALMNAAGSFDVVQTTWSDGTPTVTDTLASFDSQEINIGPLRISTIQSGGGSPAGFVYSDPVAIGSYIDSSSGEVMGGFWSESTEPSIVGKSLTLMPVELASGVPKPGTPATFDMDNVITALRKANSLTPSTFALWAGTKVLTVSNASTFVLFTKAQLQAIVGTSWTPTGSNCAVFVMNGDYGVSANMMSASINNSSEVRVHMNANRNGALRVNYLIIRFA